MRVGAVDCDKTDFPNLALMKLSAAYKKQGHIVEWYSPYNTYDKVVASSAFTFTNKPVLPCIAIKGGVGFGSNASLPDAIEHIMPDYSLYGIDYSLGFLTRGCIRKCSWCVVPDKEGAIRAHADFTEFTVHDKVVFMDNNVLASDHGIAQIEKLACTGIKVDFNQGLDARLIDDGIARRLSKLKWLAPLRLACDSKASMPSIFRAVTHLRWNNVAPRAYSCYVLVKDVEDAMERVKFLKALGIDPFCQPYRDLKSNAEPARDLRQFARWVNTKQLFKSVKWEDYKKERGDRI
jgi:hypothetical protein